MAPISITGFNPLVPYIKLGPSAGPKDPPADPPGVAYGPLPGAASVPYAHASVQLGPAFERLQAAMHI